MHDSANEIHAVVNGEIYDYDLLREKLSQGFEYMFKGHSDSELVVALYKHYELLLFHHLHNELAFCVYHSRRRVRVDFHHRFQCVIHILDTFRVSLVEDLA